MKRFFHTVLALLMVGFLLSGCSVEVQEERTDSGGNQYYLYYLNKEETKVVKDAESLSISVDGTIEEWNPMDQAGWTRRLTTGKSLGMTMGGKRNYGDEGNDYIASLALKTGQECNTWVSIIFPNLDQLLIPAVINVTSLGGDSTSIDALEWEAQSDGKPTYIPYTE